MLVFQVVFEIMLYLYVHVYSSTMVFLRYRYTCTRQYRIDRHGAPSEIYYGGCSFSRNQLAHLLRNLPYSPLPIEWEKSIRRTAFRGFFAFTMGKRGQVSPPAVHTPQSMDPKLTNCVGVLSTNCFWTSAAQEVLSPWITIHFNAV